jgi:hypothetical protein
MRDITPIIDAIERHRGAMVQALAKGDRVELIPQKDGVKVMRVKREEIKK